LASNGIYSMIAWRTRHDLSSANSTIAGRRLSDRSSMPMTANQWSITSTYWIVSQRTTIDSFKLADDIEPHFRELVLQQM
jgi:hypothetical protein